MEHISTRPSVHLHNRVWCTKILRYLKCNSNRVQPMRSDEPGCEYFTVAPRRTLRVLKPELKSGRFYEPQAPGDRPESLNDNFYLRWAKRPHPSGACRCSFRQSRNSSRLSSHEEKIISQEIQRIRTSLYEAERSGTTDIEELEKTLAVDLSQLQALPAAVDNGDSHDDDDDAGSRKSTADGSLITEEHRDHVENRLECLDEHVKKKIVQDLDRYISDLLDEILNDTIRAIARADNPFPGRGRREGSADESVSSFDIQFAFHGEQSRRRSENDGSGDKDGEPGRGYVNRGFVGSASDPDALDFFLRPGDAALENVDCVDSGINSVETIELQPEQDQNLEQSLMDIIDAKLGGSAIGKSLENLGMEIDASEDVQEANPSDSPPVPERVIQEAEDSSAPGAQKSTAPSTPPAAAPIESTPAASSSPQQPPAEPPATPPPVSARSSLSLDEPSEDPAAAFDTLRLEFRRSSAASSALQQQQHQHRKQSFRERPPPAPASAGPTTATSVTSKVNRTVSAIRQRIATKLANARCHRRRTTTTNNNNNNNNEPPQSKLQQPAGGARPGLELGDYRSREDEDGEGSVTLRRGPSGRKPTIVFLHGFGSSAEAFGHQLRYFANLGYPCVAPDLLGHGMSSAPKRARDYRFERLLADLEAVLLRYALGPGQKCVIVAHNYGCSFATALASKYTSSIHQLVLISGGGPTPLAPPAREGPGHCCLRASLAPLLVCGVHRGVLYSARGRQHPYCATDGPNDGAPSAAATVGDEDDEQKRWPSHMGYVLRGMSWPDGDYVFHRRICTPTLLVHGLRDNRVSLVQECQMERTMVKAFLEAIPAAGHMPMTDCPEQLNHMIRCFIDLWKNKKW